MKKEFIKNRKGQKIAVVVESANLQKGLVFIMHGLGSSKDVPQIVTMAETFKDQGFRVIRFDATNAGGESDGTYEQATFTNYYEDLCDVIRWSANQPWYREPFVLAGHSLGSMSITLYAQQHPEKVRALAPLATSISGKLYLATYPPAEQTAWQKTGWYSRPSTSLPGVIRRLPWSHAVDRLKYDLLEHTDRLTMPVLIVVGERDTFTPAQHQQLLFDRLPGKKEFHVIKGAEHEFKGREQLHELKEIVTTWITSAF